MQRTLLDFLIERYPTAKRQTLRRMVGAGRVRIDGVVACNVKQPVDATQKMIVDEQRESPPRRPAAPPFPIAYEDADVIVIDKPAGLLTSTVPRERRPTALALLKKHFEDDKIKIGLIHRLDRDASGLLIFSKTAAAFRALKRQFANHSVDRVYIAIVHGKPKTAMSRIESRLVEMVDGSVKSTDREDRGQRALTHYELIKTTGELSLLRVTLLTGRKHQIRVHLSEHGMPIVGDSVYGPGEDATPSKLLLTATELAFDHPRAGKRLKLQLPMPREMRELFP